MQGPFSVYTVMISSPYLRRILTVNSEKLGFPFRFLFFPYVTRIRRKSQLGPTHDCRIVMIAQMEERSDVLLYGYSTPDTAPFKSPAQMCWCVGLECSRCTDIDERI